MVHTLYGLSQQLLQCYALTVCLTNRQTSWPWMLLLYSEALLSICSTTETRGNSDEPHCMSEPFRHCPNTKCHKIFHCWANVTMSKVCEPGHVCTYHWNVQRNRFWQGWVGTLCPWVWTVWNTSLWDHHCSAAWQRHLCRKQHIAEDQSAKV